MEDVAGVSAALAAPMMQSSSNASMRVSGRMVEGVVSSDDVSVVCPVVLRDVDWIRCDARI